MQPAPFRIEPLFHPRIWGSRTLAPLYPEKSNLAEPLGEVWLTEVACRIAAGPFAGKTLGQTWKEMPREWRGSRFAEGAAFPLLVKFLFPNDKLSIQVHPNHSYAAAHEKEAGGCGKTEMWHAVSAEPGASLYLGLQPGVNEERFLEGLGSATLENLFQSQAVSAGDTFFVPPGTPHTIGPGMVLCEVQQYSDLTYRIYDYGRTDASGKPRELHIEKALDAIEFGKNSERKSAFSSLPQISPHTKILAACRYFATERWEFSDDFSAQSDPDHFALLIFLSGKGQLQWGSEQASYAPGECWFVPATLGAFMLSPSEATTVVETHVPNLNTLRSELSRKGLTENAIRSILFE